MILVDCWISVFFFLIINRSRCPAQTETSSLILPMLKPWMHQFSSILEIPVQSENPDDWSIRMEVCLVLLKVFFIFFFLVLYVIM